MHTVTYGEINITNVMIFLMKNHIKPILSARPTYTILHHGYGWEGGANIPIS
jgi:hypothetical protein